MQRPDVLSVAECWQLLGEHGVGRVSFTEGALPTIVPVTYALLGHRLLVHCRDRGMAAQVDGQVVAFQVDDAQRRTVVVTGTAERLDREQVGARSADVVILVGQIHGTLLPRVA